LIAAGEDMCEGLENLEAAVGIKQNNLCARAGDLDALIATHDAS